MPHRTNRKLIKVGETSFGVILPMAWLRFYELTDKDYVEVVSNGTVTIKPSKQLRNQQVKDLQMVKK